MGFQTFLSPIRLLITIMFFCTADSEIVYRLPNNTVPLHYDIRLIPQIEEGNAFYGETSINILIHSASQTISLHALELKINNSMTTLISDDDSTIYKPTKHIYNNITETLTLTFDELPLGLYTLNMQFLGNYSQIGFQDGFMKIPYTNKKEHGILAATFFEPSKARRMFPCWDEPAFKATFEISVLHHEKYKVLSNMPIQDEIVGPNGIWTHFSPTPKMSTYLVAIVITNYVPVSNANKTVNVWCKSSLTRQATFIHSFAEIVTSVLVQYTNSSEKVPKMDHVLVKNYPADAVGNWGLIIYE